MYARIKQDATFEVANLLPAGIRVDLSHVAVVERRIFKDGELKAFDLYFGHNNVLSGAGITITVPAELVEIL